jgi:hypothetical protein
MIKCFKCGGTEIVNGTIESPSADFSGLIFRPGLKIRFLAMTARHGTDLYPESYACLNCGTVWSETEQGALRDFIRRCCKPSETGPKS